MYPASEPSESVLLVLCTVPTQRARSLADQLLAERLVACVNFIPVSSRYRWKGEIEEAQETLLLMKTSGATVHRLRSRVAEIHSYDVPEVLQFADDSGLPAYLRWVVESCGDLADP